MNKYYQAIINTSGDAKALSRVQVLDNAGDIVTIYADKSGTRFTDATGANVNYCEADATGMVEFYWTAASDQTLQVLDSTGELERSIADFANNFSEPGTAANVDAVLGVTAADGNLGTFTGSTIPDSSAVKPALQALETAGEQTASDVAALASTAPGEGVDLIGPVESPEIPNPVVLRTILTDAQVSRMLSGAGDGDTDPAAVTAETAKFQAMCDTGRSFGIPEPDVHYAVNTIFPAYGQTIEGPGKWAKDSSNPLERDYQFVGNGVDPIFSASSLSKIVIKDLSAFNPTGGGVLLFDNCPDSTITRCHFVSYGGATTVDISESWFTQIRDCKFNGGGVGGTALRMLDYCNSSIVSGLKVSGGASGRAVQVGLAQGSVFENIGIEVSLEGFLMASTNDTGDGNCGGCVINGLYVEQCKIPLALGTEYYVIGGDVSGVFISNAQNNLLPQREACLHLGALRGTTIANMDLRPHSTEDLFWFYLNAGRPVYNKNTLGDYEVVGTPNAVYDFKGTNATDSGLRASLGGSGPMAFSDISKEREYISPMLDTTTATGFLTWLAGDDIKIGGKVKSIEIIDYDGGSLTGARLLIGRFSSATAIFDSSDLGSLPFTSGRAKLTLAGDQIRPEDMRYDLRIGGSAKFRIRIRYQAN